MKAPLYKIVRGKGRRFKESIQYIQVSVCLNTHVIFMDRKSCIFHHENSSKQGIKYA